METTPWGDDSLLLGEVLSVFGDNWQDDTTITNPSGRSRPVKINKSRERQKQEIRDLQVMVRQLEEELMRLRMKHEKRPQRTLEASAPTPANTGAMLAWEKATRRQFHARRKAEAVNARLRELLQTQTAIAEDLIQVIQRAEAARQEAYASALFPMRDATLFLSDSANDRRLEHRLYQISTQWHAPFARCPRFNVDGNRPHELCFFETSVIRDDTIESVLEVRASTVFPFARERFEDELWQYFATLRCSEDDFSLATEIHEGNDTIQGSLRATVTSNSVMGVLDARLRKQRFRNERDELIITSTTCGRPGLCTSRSKGLTAVDAIVSEDSWMRVVDAVDETSSTASSLTCLQNIRRARIQFGSTNGVHRSQIEAVKHFLAQLAEHQMQWGSEVVERRLMLGSSSHSVSTGR